MTSQPAVGLTQFRERLLLQVVAPQAGGVPAGVPTPLRPPQRSAGRSRAPGRRRVLLLAAVSVLFAFALLVGTLTRGQGSAVAASLRAAASRLDSQPRPMLPAGSYWYIRTRERVLSITSYRAGGEDRTAAAFTDNVDETWLANDGSGAQYGAHGKPFALTQSARRALAELPRGERQRSPANGMVFEGPGLIAVSLGSRQLSPANLSALPGDESRLRALIASAPGDRRLSAHEQAVSEFQAISNALFYEPFDPRVGAALYRVLATLPDVRRLAPALDALGRSGMAIAIDSGGLRWGLVIDPATGKLLERSETKIAADENDDQVPVGTVTWRQTIAETGIVPDVAVRPGGTRLNTTKWTVCKPDPNQPGQGHCVDP